MALDCLPCALLGDPEFVADLLIGQVLNPQRPGPYVTFDGLGAPHGTAVGPSLDPPNSCAPPTRHAPLALRQIERRSHRRCLLGSTDQRHPKQLLSGAQDRVMSKGGATSGPLGPGRDDDGRNTISGCPRAVPVSYTHLRAHETGRN